MPPALQKQSALPAWAYQLSVIAPMVVPIGIVMLIGVIIIPLPPVILDVLIAANLSLAAIVLLTTVYVQSPLDFSVFPSLLLATTLFRLVLNVASTRLILSAESSSPTDVTGVAGQVIEAFGEFVAGGSVVVGLIIFIILIVVQFVVITKGATRISEVAARFTLDGMPGKQMAIDADLNAGVIDEKEARQRREEITHQADFYGAMDGASKFVRGDAIAGIIITVINILGGFAVGIFDKGWPIADTLTAFTILTIGDGLVSQIPSFIIAIGSGLIVTRSSSKADLGSEMTGQLTDQPLALYITAGFLGVMAFTGLPAIPMIGMSVGIGLIAYLSTRQIPELTEQEIEAQKAADAPPTEAPVEQLLNVDTLELEIGYGLVAIVDTNRGGRLLERISKIRRELAVELGLIIPPVRIRDNIQFQSSEYHIKIRGNTIATGEVHPNKYLAMDVGLATAPIDGLKTREPAFGLDAWWIDTSHRERAEALNYTVVDPSSVLATHLTEVVKNHAAELLTREETNNIIQQLKEKSPKLVEEIIPGQIKAGEVQKVLQKLLSERVPIRDMETILETLSEWVERTRDVDVLSEYVRNALRRTICSSYIERDHDTGQSRLYCVTLDPVLEDTINSYIDRSGSGTSMSIPPQIANRVVTAILSEIQKLIEAGHHPLILAGPQVRAQVRQLIEPHLPNIAVLGYNEISKGVEVESLGLVQVDFENNSQTTHSEGPLEGAMN